MRIIGGRDYYDTALAYGRDDDIMFVRHREKILEGLQIPQVLQAYSGFDLAFKSPGDRFGRESIIANEHTFYADPIVVWFCGKRYGGVQWSGMKGASPLAPSYFWTRAELDQIVKDLGHTLVVRASNRWRGEPQLLDAHFLKHDFPDAHQYLLENKVTIVTVLLTRWGHRDPAYTARMDADNLKAIEFYRVLNAYQAFQEISQWVGNMPKDGNPMVQITDDKVKIHKAGFDVKRSFRKAKAD